MKSTGKKAAQQPKRQLRPYDIALIVMGAILLPVLTLLPFGIHATNDYFSVGSKLLGWTAKGAVQSPQSVTINWQRPSGIDVISIGSLAVFVALAILTIWYVRTRSNYRELKRLSTVNLLVAIVIVSSTVMSYALMRSHSQADQINARSSQAYSLVDNAGRKTCQEVTLLSHSSFNDASASCDKAKAVPGRTFGYGIAPAYLILASVLYIVPPLLNWYRYALSPRYVGGQKKNTLFQ